MSVTLSHIRKSFAEHSVLKDISFSLKEGEKASIIGPGGSGKTLILKILLGLLSPDEGQVDLLGYDPYKIEDQIKENLYKIIGVSFQQGGLFDFMTVKENLFFAMEHMTHFSHEDMDHRSKTLLEAVKLGRTEMLYPYELSGGMKRRVGIARALCTDPKLAIFDEPTSGLDPVTSSIILKMISDLSSIPGQILLMATSNVEIAVRFAKRVIIFHEGVIAADGPWDELLLSGPPWVQHFLGTRFLGLDIAYAKELQLPEAFIKKYWLS